MKRYLFLAVTLFFGLQLFAQAQRKANKDTEHWRYELQAAVGQAPQGAALVRVWTYSKKIYL